MMAKDTVQGSSTFLSRVSSSAVKWGTIARASEAGVMQGAVFLRRLVGNRPKRED